jgi:ketosteroid isomerase-like protein
MKTNNSIESTSNNAKEVVIKFINALNNEDFESAKDCLNDDMVFDGVLGHRNGAENYINDMKKMKFKYNIKKTFTEEKDVCLLYDIDMAGKTIFTCGLYHIKKGKIETIKVIFDPRPVLEKSKEK